MSLWADVAAALHADAHLSVAGTFTPVGGGAAVPCAVVWGVEDTPIAIGASGVRAAGRLGYLLSAEVGVASPRGGTLVVAGTTYRIRDAERDVEETSWRVDCSAG